MQKSKSLIRNASAINEQSNKQDHRNLVDWLNNIDIIKYSVTLVIMFLSMVLATQLGAWQPANKDSAICESRNKLTDYAYDIATKLGYRSSCDSSINIDNYDERKSLDVLDVNVEPSKIAFVEADVSEIDIYDPDNKLDLVQTISEFPDYNTLIEYAMNDDFSEYPLLNCEKLKVNMEKNEVPQLLKTFNQIIGYQSVDLKSQQETIQAINNSIIQERDQYADTKVLLEPEFIASIQSSVRKLDELQQKLVESKQIMNQNREKFIRLFRDLGTENERYTKLDENLKLHKMNYIDVQKYLSSKLNELKDNESSLVMLDNNVTDLNVNYERKMDTLNDTKDEISKLKNGHVQQLDKLEALYSNENGTLSSLKDRFDAIKSELEISEAERRSQTQQIDELKSKLNSLGSKKSIHSIRLNVLIGTKKIKQLLEGVLNRNTNIEDLKALMDNKIGEEERLIKLTKLYEKESQKMDGQTELKNKTGDIRVNIEKDKEDYMRIIESYQEFKNAVEQYEDEELEINNLKVKISDIEAIEANLRSMIEHIESSINALNIKINALVKNAKNYEDDYKKAADAFKSKADELDRIRKVINELNDQLEGLENEALSLNDGYRVSL